jgi:hypothetical protein
MSNHTPGPWTINDRTVPKGGYLRIEGPDGQHVCDLFPFARQAIPRENVDANARLIANSPQALALLSALVSAWDAGDGENVGQIYGVVEQCRAFLRDDMTSESFAESFAEAASGTRPLGTRG